jgi:hypothetical protein
MTRCIWPCISNLLVIKPGNRILSDKNKVFLEPISGQKRLGGVWMSWLARCKAGILWGSLLEASLVALPGRRKALYVPWGTLSCSSSGSQTKYHTTVCGNYLWLLYSSLRFSSRQVPGIENMGSTLSIPQGHHLLGESSRKWRQHELPTEGKLSPTLLGSNCMDPMPFTSEPLIYPFFILTRVKMCQYPFWMRTTPRICWTNAH